MRVKTMKSALDGANVRRRISAIALAATMSIAWLGGPAASPAQAAASDSFYVYNGSAPLASLAPGTVLATRTMPYSVLGLPTPVTAVQLLYRTTDAQGKPAANVTTVLKTPASMSSRAVSYQSFYDSMNPEDAPSRAIAGNVSLGGLIANAESLFLVPLLTQGYTVVMPDTEGQQADFGYGPEYGTNTLDSMRAASNAAATGLTQSTKFGMIGYSGGAIATNWAAQLAPAYAPDVNARLVGATDGGVLVDPVRNLRYVGGSAFWAGVIPMDIAGVARAKSVDVTPYLNPYGQQVFARMQSASIVDVNGHYPGLTWQQLAKPQYADITSVPVLAGLLKEVNMAAAPTPTIPMFIGQGTAGWQEGTLGNKPGIGAGDGVMIAGDVRTLARRFCADGNPKIQYTQYDLTGHNGTTALWAPVALGWLNDRFAGKAAPTDCGDIPPGNVLTP